MASTPGEGGASRALATLAVQAGPRIGSEHPISQPVVSIGKGAQSDVVIDDDSVSTTHAQLEYEHGAWRLTDLESTNGTFVEGVRLAPNVPTPLPFGASVRFGGVRMHFRPVEDADPEGARAAFAPPPRTERVAERKGGFRFPVWAAVLVVLLIALAVLLFGVLGGDEPASEPAVVEEPAQGAALLLAPLPPALT